MLRPALVDDHRLATKTDWLDWQKFKIKPTFFWIKDFLYLLYVYWTDWPYTVQKVISGIECQTNRSCSEGHWNFTQTQRKPFRIKMSNPSYTRMSLGRRYKADLNYLSPLHTIYPSSYCVKRVSWILVAWSTKAYLI